MTHQDFIAAYLGSKSERELADKTGLDTRKCASIAANMRRKGVELPKMPRRRGWTFLDDTFTDRFDKDALNKFILER